MDAQKMNKVISPLIQKLEKLEKPELAAELSWCWGSYQHDQNPSGLLEKSTLALEVIKTAREKNTKQVAKKLVQELESALT